MTGADDDSAQRLGPTGLFGQDSTGINHKHRILKQSVDGFYVFIMKIRMVLA